ncbi:MAG: HD domain-containing protein [Alphaproteobacteria bacterium]|nr:HD domain-containing protein [Alphaproteobacteria bacterium]
MLEEIEAIFAAHGDARYSEVVTQRQHALQCAQQAETAGSDSALVTAALLHDIGHMLHKHGPEPAARGIDDRHEDIGAGWLAKRFPPSVTEPVRMHVDAKRYLCAVEPDYFETLSLASVRSLELQGGPMSRHEAAVFEALPYASDAVALRRWDEGGKVADARTPALEDYLGHIRASVVSGSDVAPH